MNESQSLFAALTETERKAIAQMFGFACDPSAKECAGFRNMLREIPAPAVEFTLGFAFRLCLGHLVANKT